MQFSFSTLPREAAGDFLMAAQRAEAAGIDALWIADETLTPDPFVLTGAIAAATSRIGIGIGIADPAVRHPLHIARGAAALADLRQDGIIVGLGSGSERARSAIGVSDSDAAQTMRGAVLAIRGLLAGETVTVDAPAFRLDRARLRRLPPHPVEIVVAAQDADMVRLASQVADGVVVEGAVTADAIAGIRALVGETRPAEAPPARIVAWNLVLCTDDLHAVHGSLRRNIGRTISELGDGFADLHGLDPDLVHAVRVAVGQDDRQRLSDLLTVAVLDRLVIAGGPEHCAERILDLEAAGLDMLAVRPCLDMASWLDFDRMVHELWGALSERRLARGMAL
jgi:alkanesulfonate monooxygenase SsuD/methylene tetrahydromethanopterin reductase-like flavin-dependent oxidoreductase (luciferase family)